MFEEDYTVKVFVVESSYTQSRSLVFTKQSQFKSILLGMVSPFYRYAFIVLGPTSNDLGSILNELYFIRSGDEFKM